MAENFRMPSIRRGSFSLKRTISSISRVDRFFELGGLASDNWYWLANLQRDIGNVLVFRSFELLDLFIIENEFGEKNSKSTRIYRSAARVRRITCSSESVGVSWSVFDGTVDVPMDVPIFDDMLPIELNAEPIFALPLIDDGLYVATGWNGLRDCDTGSGLNSARDESANETIFEWKWIKVFWFIVEWSILILFENLPFFVQTRHKISKVSSCSNLT